GCCPGARTLPGNRRRSACTVRTGTRSRQRTPTQHLRPLPSMVANGSVEPVIVSHSGGTPHGERSVGMSSRVYNKDTGKYDLIKEDWRNAKVIVGRAGIRVYPEYLVNDSRLTEGYFRAPDGTLFDYSEISLCHVVIDEHGNNVAVEW